MAAPTPWEPGPPATSPTCSTNYSQHFNKKTSFVPMKGFISIIGLLLPCTTTSHKTSVEPSLAGITPQTLATLISRPIPLPDQDTLDFLHSVLHGADVALDRRVLVHQDIEPFAHDSDTPGLRSAVQNKASARLLALPANSGVSLFTTEDANSRTHRRVLASDRPFRIMIDVVKYVVP